MLQTVKVLRYNKCSSLSLIRLPWKCGIVIQAVQHLHINGVSGGGIWGSAETEWDMQGANFHIHHCESAKFRSYFQYFTSQTISPLKNKKYKFSTCKISYLDLAPDRNLVRWRLRVQPEHWQAVWCSVGHPTQFPWCQAHCKQQELLTLSARDSRSRDTSLWVSCILICFLRYSALVMRLLIWRET